MPSRDLLNRLFGFLLSLCVVVGARAGSNPSPEGSWQASISGPGFSGVAILSVNPDNTIDGYAITSRGYVVSIITGSWSQNGKKISGDFSVDDDGVVDNFNFTGSAVFGKSLSIKAVNAVDPSIKCSLVGKPLPALGDLSGTYVGSGRTGPYAMTATFELVDAGEPGAYDVTGTVVVGGTDTYTFTGSAIIDGAGVAMVVVTENSGGFTFNFKGKVKSGKFSANGQDLDTGSRASVSLTKS